MLLDPTELFPEIPNIYDFPSVHAAMIYDQERVRAYESAISHTVRGGDTVVDLGSGTGLLAFLCLRAGAERVYAIERSEIIESAREIARANGLADRIVFHHGDSREIELPECVDVIVSELMGHLAFEEGMVEAMFDARSRFLKRSGCVIPQSVSIMAAPVCCEDIYASNIECWEPVYGIDYSVMRSWALRSTYVAEIQESECLALPQPTLSMSLCDDWKQSRSGSSQFRIHRDGNLNGVGFWFNATLADRVNLSSGPWSRTHWLQCFSPLPEPIRVAASDIVEVTLSLLLRSNASDKFGFNLTVDVRESNAR